MSNDNSNRIGQSVEPETKSLADIVGSFLVGYKKLWFISVLLMVVGGLFGYFNYKKNYVPYYESKATITITAAEYNGTDQSYTNNSQLTATLSVCFNYLINNEVFYEVVENDIGLSYMPSSISISMVPGTNIINIVVGGGNYDLNYKVLTSVMNNYSDVAGFVIGDTKLTLIEEPTVGTVPTNPYNPYEAAFMFAFIGFFVGVLPSVAYAFLIKTIKNKKDIERYLSVTCFGALPAVLLEKKDDAESVCSIQDRNVGFRYLEAMRAITNRCDKVLKKNNCKVILVTSTKKGEGKSTFAMNLAYSLSKTQSKVLLIDGDLRKPDLRNKIKITMPTYSMADFIRKDIRSSEAIVNIDSTRILLLAPNKVTANPIEILNSDTMANFIKSSRDVVNYIIIDAPPCADTSDAAVWAKHCDGIIYVVKEDTVRVNKIMDTIQEFSYTRVPIVGSVLNGSLGRLSLARNYGYGYAKRYAYGYGNKKKSYGKGYGYGYGYGRSHNYDYGAYGEYGEISDSEFQAESQKVSKKISMTTTDEQKRAIEDERMKSHQAYMDEIEAELTSKKVKKIDV